MALGKQSLHSVWYSMKEDLFVFIYFGTFEWYAARLHGGGEFKSTFRLSSYSKKKINADDL